MKALLLLILALVSVKARNIDRFIRKAMKNISDEDIINAFNIDREDLKMFQKRKEISKLLGKNSDEGCVKRNVSEIPEQFRFFPLLMGKLYRVKDKIEFSNYCFRKGSVEFANYQDDEILLKVEMKDPSSLLCQDHLIFNTPNILFYKMFFFEKKQEISISIKPEYKTEIAVQGLRVFSLCTDLIDTVKSIITMIKFFFIDPFTANSFAQTDDWFFGDGVEESEKEKIAINFYKTYLNVTPELRVGHEKDVLDVEKYIKSGDYICTSLFTHGLGILLINI